MKFKVGDRVKVVDCTIRGKKCVNFGKVFTVKKIKKGLFCPYILDGTTELFKDSELELVNQFTKADLKHGDKCTLKNGQVIFFDKTSKYSFNNIDEQLRYFNDDVSIVKVERPVEYETVFEREEEILDETEKRYLLGVIRPFKDKVEYIQKNIYSTGVKEIRIATLKTITGLPAFTNDMYKGMEKNRKYTLKELGL